MKLIVRITDVFLYTSLFTACCAVGLCMATERLIGNATPALFTPLHSLVFGSALLVYNTQHIIRWKRKVSRLNQWLRSWYFFFFFTGVAMSVSSLLWLPCEVLAASIILALFTFTYSWPLLPFKNKRRLREFGLLKILVLTSVWTIVTSILPMLNSHGHISSYPFEIMLRFVFIFALCIIFDIRDMQTDLANNISTLPNKIGIENSYRLINAALAIFGVLSIVQYFRHPAMERLATAFLTAIITRMVVGYLRKHPSGKAYLALADGMMMFYATLILLAPAT